MRIPLFIRLCSDPDLSHRIARRRAVGRQTGEYRAESLSSEGFIHFSGIHQLLGVANRFYAGLHGQVILAVDPSRLTAQLKYEAPVHPVISPAPLKNEDFPADERLTENNTFPHLYGPLNFDAVVATYDFEPDSNGQFSLPAWLRSAL